MKCGLIGMGDRYLITEHLILRICYSVARCTTAWWSPAATLHPPNARQSPISSCPALALRFEVAGADLRHRREQALDVAVRERVIMTPIIMAITAANRAQRMQALRWNGTAPHFRKRTRWTICQP